VAVRGDDSFFFLEVGQLFMGMALEMVLWRCSEFCGVFCFRITMKAQAGEWRKGSECLGSGTG